MEEAFGCKPARWREAALPTQFLNTSGTTLAQFADGARYIVTRFARAVLRIQNCVTKKNAGGEFAHANPMCRGENRERCSSMEESVPSTASRWLHGSARLHPRWIVKGIEP